MSDLNDGEKVFGVIGGSGFYQFPHLRNASTISIETPFGSVAELVAGELFGATVYFLARHGQQHKLPPHKINYRANVWGLRELGVTTIISVNAVGGIHTQASPGVIVVPDQIIDYTWGRDHTFADSLTEVVNHIDFTWPFNSVLREILLSSCTAEQLRLLDKGVYGCCQGPRLETAAEIRRLQRDGCDVVGMTVMPEAALARELKMDYAALCPVVNWAAGLSEDVIELREIEACLQGAIPPIQRSIERAIEQLLGSE